MPNQHRNASGTSEHQPDEAGVLDVGRRAGGDLADERSRRPSSASSARRRARRTPQSSSPAGSGSASSSRRSCRAPALMPSAVPCSRLGKNVLMFDIEHAKLPPPTPDSSARSWNTHSGQSLSCSAMPVPIAGIISIAVVRKMVLRPPARRIRNDAGMRSVAPAMPGDRRQREELRLREREAEVQHLDGDDSPHHPDREAAEQARHRDPQVAVRDALAGRLPELVVLGAPVGDVAELVTFGGGVALVVRCSSSSPSSIRWRFSP